MRKTYRNLMKFFLSYFKCDKFCDNELITTWKANRRSLIANSFHCIQNLKKSMNFYKNLLQFKESIKFWFWITFILRLVLSKELVLRYISSNDLYDFEASLLIEAVIKLNVKCEPIVTKKHKRQTKNSGSIWSSNSISCNRIKFIGIKV